MERRHFRLASGLGSSTSSALFEARASTVLLSRSSWRASAIFSLVGAKFTDLLLQIIQAFYDLLRELVDRAQSLGHLTLAAPWTRPSQMILCALSPIRR